MNVPLTIVVGTRNRPREFRRLYRSIREHTEADWTLIVADATDSGQCYTHDRQIISIADLPPSGIIPGYNRAFDLAYARGCEYACWLNDDCEVMPGWDTAAIRCLEQDSRIGIVAMSWCDDHGKQGHVCQFMVRAMHRVVYANFGLWRGGHRAYFDPGLSSAYGCDNSLCCWFMDAGMWVVGCEQAQIRHYRHHDEIREMRYKDLVRTGNNFWDRYKHKWANYLDIMQESRHLQPERLMEG